LRGAVVEIEEAARTSHRAVGELEVVEAMHGHEPVRCRQCLADVRAVRAERAPGHAGVRPANERRRRGLHPQIREGVPQAGGVTVERLHSA
jgi:hypothetical protein